MVNLGDWQDIQDSFSDVLEITLNTISAHGELLTRPSRSTRLCAKIMPTSRNLRSVCRDCVTTTSGIANLDESAERENTPKCPFGLSSFAIPIRAVGRRIVAYIIAGPVLLKSREKALQCAAQSKDPEIDPKELTDAIMDISVFSYSKARSVIALINDTFSHMAQSGYHKKRLGEIAPEVVKMDPLFSSYYEEKILKSLLHSCVLALNADSGSVMIMDKNTHMLRIKVASELDKSIIAGSNVRMGEGVAGVAAETATPIILPKDKDSAGLCGKLKRNYIRSSMVIPFSKADTQDIYGVININVVRNKTDFTEKDIDIVKELVRLTGIALLPLSPHAMK
ncbi:MAG: PocR ligand-binding domain-containing protein [Candidatus Omnitrophica bacterium]|nr:PocR ligand-binding domain-containing protein [Candidatus Omnitrophota bacterium]